MDRYLEQPWSVRAGLISSGSPAGLWWESLVTEVVEEGQDKPEIPVASRAPSPQSLRLRISPVERLFRSSLVAFTPLVDQWILRILCASHPPLAVHLWPLVLTRAKGLCLIAQQPNEPPSRQPTPSRISTPSPESPESGQNPIVYKPFDRPYSAFNGPRLFFELEDADSVADSTLVELGQVLDLVEVMRFGLLKASFELFRATMEFLFEIITRPEGKAQRQKTADLVMRSCGAIAYFLSGDATKTKRAMAEVFQGSLERAVGSIARVSYYNPGATLVNWLKQAIMKEDESQLGNVQHVLDECAAEQVRIPNRECESTYRLICMNPSVAKSIRDDVLERLDAGETDLMFVNIVLTVAYEHCDRYDQFGDAISRWKTKMFIRNNERIDAFLNACSAIQASKQELQ